MTEKRSIIAARQIVEALEGVRPKFLRWGGEYSPFSAFTELAEKCPACGEKAYRCCFSGPMGGGGSIYEEYVHICVRCRHSEFKDTWYGYDGSEWADCRCLMCGHHYGDLIPPEGTIRVYTLTKGALWRHRVQLVDVSRVLIPLMLADEANLYRLAPEQFELFLCERLSTMGMEVRRVGRASTRDGGVDIVAWPAASTTMPWLLAVQAKHHSGPRIRTGPAAVREFQAVIAGKPFNAGLLVTNTTFTPSAQWFAKNHAQLVRLRDVADVKRWLIGQWADPADWREIPSAIELGPGIVVRIPHPGSSAQDEQGTK